MPWMSSLGEYMRNINVVIIIVIIYYIPTYISLYR